MANAEHLALLVDSSRRWNRERPEHPDLSDANLSEINLGRANLSRADLSRARLTRADLIGADLIGADLRGADLSEATLSGANLFRANVSLANLTLADFRRATLSRADLNGANLRRANLHGADLRRANLRRANLYGADLFAADLSGANLFGANLSYANLREVNLGRSVLAALDLRDVAGLDSVRHEGPSSIGVDTLYASAGQVPEVFWRGCGIPELLIRYLPDLTVDAHSYFSAFISYSHADAHVADRLHEDLFIGRKISCWKDSHDLRAGEPIAGRIRTAIRAETDKVLLLCSQSSLNSEWVDDELNTVFGLERELGNARRDSGDRESRVHLVIPVDLDGYLFSPACDHQWTDRIRERLAVDLRNWQTPSDYQNGLERVVKALEADPATIRPGRRLW